MTLISRPYFIKIRATKDQLKQLNAVDFSKSTTPLPKDVQWWTGNDAKEPEPIKQNVAPTGLRSH